MQKISIAIIRPNKITYSTMDMTHSRFTKEKLLEDLEDYVEIVNVDGLENMMEKIVEVLKLTPDITAHTTTCKEDNNYIYQMCHLIDESKTYQQNNICIRLANSLYRVIGDVVLMKSKVLSDGKTVPCNITEDDVVELYQECLIKKCVRILPDGTVDDVSYIFNPIDWLSPDKLANIRFHEVDFSDKVMMFFVELTPENNTVNTKASILYGKQIFGNVVVAMRQKQEDIKHTEFEYYSLDNKTMNKIVSVMSVPNDILKIQTPETKSNQIVNNFHTILEKKYSLYKSKYTKDDYSLELFNQFDTTKSVNQISREMVDKSKAAV